MNDGKKFPKLIQTSFSEIFYCNILPDDLNNVKLSVAILNSFFFVC